MTEAICIITVLTWAITLVAVYRRGREDGYDEGYDVARNRNGADRVRENRESQRDAEIARKIRNQLAEMGNSPGDVPKCACELGAQIEGWAADYHDRHNTLNKLRRKAREEMAAN